MKKSKRERAPTVIVGVVCENVLIEKDGVVSAIRIVDKLLVRPRDKKASGTIREKGIVFHGRLLLILRVEQLKSLTVKIQLQGPEGEVLFEWEHPTKIAEGQSKININVELNLGLKSEGHYVFKITTPTQRLIDIPFQLVHLPPADEAS
jgi:hypothetical protein